MDIQYYLLKILNILTLGVVCSPCPVCRKGVLQYKGMDEKWEEIYKCDTCGKEFK